MNETNFTQLQTNFIIHGSLKAERDIPKPVSSDEDIIHVLASINAYTESSIRSEKDDLSLTYYSVQSFLGMHDFAQTSLRKFKLWN